MLSKHSNTTKRVIHTESTHKYNKYKIHHTTNDKTHSLSGHQQCQITKGSFAEKSMDLQQMTNSKLFQRNTKQKLTNSKQTLYLLYGVKFSFFSSMLALIGDLPQSTSLK